MENETNNKEMVEQTNDTKGNTTPTPKKGGQMNSMIYNIGVPILCLFQLPKLLVKFGGLEQGFSNKLGLVIALAFPAGYFIYHLAKEKKTSMMAVVGFLGILVTGLIGLLELPREYVAYERAAVPLVFALAILGSNFTKSPLVKKLFYNPMMFNTEKIEQLLKKNNTEKDFEGTLTKTSFILAGSFLFSSICNYFITQHYMLDESLSFNDAYAKVKLMSIAITIVPLMIFMVGAIFFFQKQLVKHTGVADSEELYADSITKN